MCNQEWYSSLAQLYPLNFGQFIFRFFCSNAVDCEPSFSIIDETEVLAGLLDRDNIHETGRVCGVGADFPVYFDKALHNDGLGFAGVESILQSGKGQRNLPCRGSNFGHSPIADKDNEWHTISELVRTWGWAGRIGTGQFIQKPMRGRAETLLMLLPTVISAKAFWITSNDDQDAILTVHDP